MRNEFLACMAKNAQSDILVRTVRQGKKWSSVSEQRSPSSEYYSKGLLFAVLFRRVCSIMFSCVTYLETSNNTFDVFCSIVTCGPYYLISFFSEIRIKRT